MITRRGFLGSILALGAAPAIVRADSLMRIVAPQTLIYRRPTSFDLGVGSYDVVVDCGPSYAFERARVEEQLRQLVAFSRTDAAFMAQIIPKLYDDERVYRVLA